MQNKKYQSILRVRNALLLLAVVLAVGAALAGWKAFSPGDESVPPPPDSSSSASSAEQPNEPDPPPAASLPNGEADSSPDGSQQPELTPEPDPEPTPVPTPKPGLISRFWSTPGKGMEVAL